MTSVVSLVSRRNILLSLKSYKVIESLKAYDTFTIRESKRSKIRDLHIELDIPFNSVWVYWLEIEGKPTDPGIIFRHPGKKTECAI